MPKAPDLIWRDVHKWKTLLFILLLDFFGGTSSTCHIQEFLDGWSTKCKANFKTSIHPKDIFFYLICSGQVGLASCLRSCIYYAVLGEIGHWSRDTCRIRYIQVKIPITLIKRHLSSGKILITLYYNTCSSASVRFSMRYLDLFLFFWPLFAMQSSSGQWEQFLPGFKIYIH